MIPDCRHCPRGPIEVPHFSTAPPPAALFECRPHWYRHKEETSFADILTTLRRLSYEEKIEGELPKRSRLKTWIAQFIELLSRTG